MASTDALASLERPDWVSAPLPGANWLLVEEAGEGGVIRAHDVAALGKAVLTVGRSSGCDVVISSKSLSREHAAIVFGEAGRIGIADLGGAVTGLALDQAGTRLTTSGADGELRVWDFHAMDAGLESKDAITVGDGQPVFSLAMSPSGASLLVTDGTQRPRVLDREGGALVVFAAGDNYVRDVRQTKGHTAAATCCAWSPVSETVVATAGADGAARMWDLGAAERATALKEGGVGPGSRKGTFAKGKIRATMGLINPFGELYCGAVIRAAAGVQRAGSAPSRGLGGGGGAAAGRAARPADELDSAVRSRRGRRRQPTVAGLEGHSASSASSAAAAASAASAAASGNTMAEFTGDAGGGLARPPVTSIAFAPDGRTLVLGVGVGALQLWDLRSHLTLPSSQRADAHAPGTITFAGYAPGGTGHCLGTRSSGDSCVRLWDARALGRGPTLALSGVATSGGGATVCWAGAQFGALALGSGRGSVPGAPSPVFVVNAAECEARFGELRSARGGGTTGVALPVGEVAASSVCEWGDVGSEMVSWHAPLGQLFVGCGDGTTRGLWSEHLSRRGLRDAVGKGIRATGVVVADESSMLSSTSMPIYTPNALPMFRDETGPFAARKRGRGGGGLLEGKPAPSAYSVRHAGESDPITERQLAAARIGMVPTGPSPLTRADNGAAGLMRPGKGAGGDIAADKSIAQFSRQKDLVPGGVRAQNPRDELLRFAAAPKVFTRIEVPVALAGQTLEDELEAEPQSPGAEAGPKRLKRR